MPGIQSGERPADQDRTWQITQAIARGDAGAFTSFFHNHFDEMYREARRVTRRDEAFCLDVVQDAMVRVIRRMKPLDSQEQLRGWIKSVVRSCAFDGLRRESRRQRRELRSGQTDVPTDAGELTEQLEWLRSEMARLAQAEVGVLTLRYQLGWTLQRIGDLLGLKPGAVDRRIQRIVARLRSRFWEEHHD